MLRVRLLYLLFLVFFAFGFSTAKVRAEEGVSDVKYRIGVILPLSGSAASLGRYSKNGIDLAYSKLSDDVRSKVEIFYEDDQLDSKKTVSAYHKLVTQNNVGAILSFASSSGNVLGPLAERNKKVLIAIGASDVNIVKGRKFVFTHWVIPDIEARLLAKEFKSRGFKKIAYVSTEQEGAIAFVVAIKQAFKEAGLSDRLVYVQSFLPDVRDFRVPISQLKALKVDATVVLLFPGAIAPFVKQARALGLDSEIAGIELFEDQHEVEASDGAMVGKWYVNADLPSSWFDDLYSEAYGGEHSSFGSGNAFDALTLIANAVVKYKGDSVKVAEHLRTLKDYHGAAGTYSGTGDNRFTLPATLKIITDDGFEKLHKD